MTEKRRHILAFLATVAVLLAARPVPGQPATAGNPVNDAARMQAIAVAAGKLMQAGKLTPIGELIKQLSRTQWAHAAAQCTGAAMTPETLYQRCRESVLILVVVGQRGNTRQANAASAFLIGPDGEFVANYHTINQPDKTALVAMTFDGRIFPVREILAADKAADLVIGRLDTGGVKLLPLPLATGAAAVGANVNVISHPDNRFYFFSRGVVGRYQGTAGKARMLITADFAMGSSGAPVLDDCGAVVGIAASTSSVYYGTGGKDTPRLQMVFKQCIPVAALKKLIRRP